MPDAYDVEFLIGDLFPADDPLARYVVRLSTALGDLRVAASPLIRSFDETPDYARMYHVRITAGHASEFAQLIDPEGPTVLPSLDDCLKALAGVDDALHRTAIDARDELFEAFNERLPFARTTLRREVNRLRHQAFHYGYKRGNDKALQRAMTAAADLPGIYRVKPGAHRAMYADEISHQLMHPRASSDEEQTNRLRELHQGLARVLPASSRLVMNVEALWIGPRLDRATVRPQR